MATRKKNTKNKLTNGDIKRLFRYFESAKKTQAALATQFDVSPATISYWKNKWVASNPTSSQVALTVEEVTYAAPASAQEEYTLQAPGQNS